MTTVKKDWYKDAFDQKYLDTYIDQLPPERTKKEVDFLVSIFEKYKVKSVLDTACGYGRHSVPLSRAGFSVLGIDQSEYFIKKATAESKNIVGVDFLVEDIRDTIIPADFDAAVNMFTSWGYFENDIENQKVLENISISLKEGGIFILDLPNPNNFKNEEYTETLSNRLTVTTKIETDGTAVHMTRSWDGKSYEAYFKTYSRNMIEKMLSTAGFEIVESYGSFDRGVLDVNTSLRYIFVSRKS